MKSSPAMIVAVALACGVLAFVLNFALSALGANGVGMTLIVSLLAFSLVIVAVGIYNNLRGTRAVPVADDAARRDALEPPPSGQAQLLVVREGFVGKLQGVDVLVDGVQVTQLKSPRFAAIMLVPGPHEVEVRGKGMAPARCGVKLDDRGVSAVRISMEIGRILVIPQSVDDAFWRQLAVIPMVAAS